MVEEWRNAYRKRLCSDNIIIKATIVTGSPTAPRAHIDAFQICILALAVPYASISVVAPKCTFLGVLVRHNNVHIGQYKTHWIWLVAGIEWVTLRNNEGWRQKVRGNECRNVWMQVIKQGNRMKGMSVWANDIKIVGVDNLSLSNGN